MFLGCRLAILNLADRNTSRCLVTGSDRGDVHDLAFFLALKALLALCRRKINLISISMSVRPRRFNSARAKSAKRRFVVAGPILALGFVIWATCGGNRLGSSRLPRIRNHCGEGKHTEVRRRGFDKGRERNLWACRQDNLDNFAHKIIIPLNFFKNNYYSYM